jgi:hypothetical protein
MGDFNRWTMISDGSLDQYRDPDLSLDEKGDVHSTFSGAEDFYYFRRICYASSRDANESWSDPNRTVEEISTNYHMLQPRFVKTTTKDIWIVFSKYNDGFNGLNIRFTKSTDGGNTFSPSLRVDDGSPSDVYKLLPGGASCGDSLFVAWREGPYLEYVTRMNRSFDGGETWLESDLPVNDSYLVDDLSRPVLLLDPAVKTLYVAWGSPDGDVYAASSRNYGDSWSEPVKVDDPDAYLANAPDMTLGQDGTLYLVWYDFRTQVDTDVYFVRSTDGGETWTDPPVMVNDDVTPGNQYEPHISLDTWGRVHVGFIHNIPWQFEVNLYYTRSLDGGNSWESPNMRVNDVPDMVAPMVPATFSIAGEPLGSAYLAWRDSRNVADIHCGSNIPLHRPRIKRQPF